MTGPTDDKPALYFEDVSIGSEFVSAARRVTEADLELFTTVSGDHHPIHTDRAFAKASVFGQRILQGPFGVAVAVGLFTEFTEFTEASIALTDISQWRFFGPVFVGDELTLRMRIESARRVSTGDRGVIQRRMELINQRGEVVQDGLMGLMMWCRSGMPD